MAVNVGSGRGGVVVVRCHDLFSNEEKEKNPFLTRAIDHLGSLARDPHEAREEVLKVATEMADQEEEVQQLRKAKANASKAATKAKAAEKANRRAKERFDDIVDQLAKELEAEMFASESVNTEARKKVAQLHQEFLMAAVDDDRQRLTKRSALGILSSFQMFYFAVFFGIVNLTMDTKVTAVIALCFGVFIWYRTTSMRKDFSELEKEIEKGNPVPDPDVSRYIFKTIWNKRWFKE